MDKKRAKKKAYISNFMKRFKLLTYLLVLGSLSVFGQGAKNIKINEVMTKNTASIVDEYDMHLPWIELANVSFTTFNVRGMYVTTDTTVLNKSLSVPDRVAKMSIIPNNEVRTNMGGRQHLLLFLNSLPTKGSTHLTASIDPDQPVWIGLFDGNGVDLIDSVTVPPLNENTSFARESDGAEEWSVKSTDAVTPGIENFIHVTESKVAQIKRDDPHGFGITILSMGIVFSCLALLCIFFTIFGRIMSHRQREKHASAKKAHRERMIAAQEEDEDERAFPAVTIKNHSVEETADDVYVAVISMAIKEYLDDIHDTESGIITITPKQTKWTRI